MEIRNKNEQTIGLYENYGLRVIGKTATYYSDLFNEEKDIITHIGIINTATGGKIYSRTLENNFIFMGTFSRCIDEVLYYFSHNTLDTYSLNKTIEDVLIHNNGSLFVHRMQQEIEKEEKHVAMIRTVEEYEKEYNQVVETCNKKNHTLYRDGSDFYILAFINDESKQRFLSTPEQHQPSYIEHAGELGINIVIKQETNMCCYDNKWYYVGINELLEQIA